MSRPLHILLLGGSGFVGRALLRELAAMPPGSVRVRALLRDPDAVPDAPYLEKVRGSLEAPPADLEPGEPYVLVDFAVKQIDADRTGYRATNVEATGRLLSGLGPRLTGVLYGSSMSVYGPGAQDGVAETAPLRPASALAESRLEAETRITELARARGVSALLLRPRFVLGDGDRFVLPNLAKLLRRRVQLASGAQRFSIIDVADYARIVLRLAAVVADLHHAGTPVQRALNVGHAAPVTFAQIADAIGASLGLPAPRVRLPVSERITRWLRRLPARGMDAIATRLELVGLSHWGDTSSLAAMIGNDIVSRDPMITVRRAAAGLIATKTNP
jgi:nucleoside-diphosphate-sugar epimerase